jgi:anti-sigma factor RsiW
MSPGCGEARLSLGAYLLGALARADRALVDTHVRTCADCRAELGSMSALPGLLARIQQTDIIAQRVDPSPGLLDRVLSAAAAQRRRTRRIHVAATVAACVTLAAGASIAVHLADPATQPMVTSVAATKVFTATDPTTRVSAAVTETPTTWGVALEVNVHGPAISSYGGDCRLVAVEAGGDTDVAASWSAPGSGHIDAPGATAFAAEQITAFRVVGSTGATLVVVPTPRGRSSQPRLSTNIPS